MRSWPPRRPARPNAICRPPPSSTARRSGGSISWPRRTRWAFTPRRNWRASWARSSTTRARASSKPNGPAARSDPITGGGRCMRRRDFLIDAGLASSMLVGALTVPHAARAQGLEGDAEAALKSLYRSTPAAKNLGSKASGILVFPKIIKAGFLVGAQYGDGTLFKNGRPAGRYNIAAGSYGFQAGVQGFAYAMFFMTDSALSYLENSAGFEIGAGPSVVVVDSGKAKTLTTTTARDDVYAFVFGQKGLMAGVGLQGSKITKVGQ